VTISRREFLKSLTFFAGVAAVPSLAAATLVGPPPTQEVDESPLFGQKTLKDASALDQISHRRRMIFIRRAMEDTLHRTYFEPIDEVTFHAITSMMGAVMTHMDGMRALYKYKVTCDSTNNLPEHLEKNQVVLEVAVKFTPALSEGYHILKVLCSRGQ